MRRTKSTIAARAALALIAATLAAPLPAKAGDLAKMSMAEIDQLQRRLADAGCFKGAIDGKPTDATKKAIAECPDQDPVLRIETGMHTAPTYGLAVDAACRRLVTGSRDKTLRVWSLPSGTLERTVRVPSGGTNEGMIYATALSPDGRWTAYAGWDARNGKEKIHQVTLVDLERGTIRRLGRFSSTIHALAFSTDGRRIGIGTFAGGVRVLDREDGRELLADPAYKDRIQGLTFDAAGNLFASSHDGHLRRYTPGRQKAIKVVAPDGLRPNGVAIDPSGRRLAVVYDDKAVVSILDAGDLHGLAKGVADGKTNGSFWRVAWSPDGSSVSAAGSARNNGAPWHRSVHHFDPNGAAQVNPEAVGLHDIANMSRCDNGLIYVTTAPSIGRISSAQSVATLMKSPIVDMRGKLDNAFTVANDGASVRFGLGLGTERPVIFDLVAASLTESVGTRAGLSPPLIRGLPITDWLDSAAPKFDGKQIGLVKLDHSYSIAIRSDLAGFVLGTAWMLRAHDATGKELWKRNTPSEARGVNLAQDGKLIVAALTDGTIRWYRWEDGVELLALFVEVPTKRWVAWTPSGHYMASPGGEDLIGWQINRGWEQEPDFFPAARFRDRFNRPDVVQRVLTTLDVAKAVAAADAEARRKADDGASLAAKLPPVLRITTPSGGTSFSAGRITIEYDLRSPSGLPVDRIEILIDGRPVTTRGLARVDAAKLAPGTGRLEVDLPPRDVEVGLIARAGDLVSEPARLRLTHAATAPAKPEDVLKPKLYVLAVGNADYADPSLRLGFAAKDARDFAAVLKRQEGGLYGAVETKILVDAAANRDGVLEGFEWLEKQVTSRDVAVVFLAGHGVTDEKGTFWYLPNDAGPKSLRSRGVSQDDLKRTMQALPSKAILFLDSCHAAKGTAATAQTRGAVDVNSVVNDLAAAENGVVTFAAATGRELAQENVDWGNGAFTKALLEGIGDGKAAALGNGRITLSELDAYVAERVKTLTGGTQHPVMTRPATVTNFPIALVGK